MAPYIANSLRGAQQCAGSLLFKAHQHLSQLPGRKDCALCVVGSQTGLPELRESVCEVQALKKAKHAGDFCHHHSAQQGTVKSP